MVLCSQGYSSLDAAAEGIGAAKRVTASAKLVEVGFGLFAAAVRNFEP